MKPFELTDLPTRRYQVQAWDSARWEGFEFRDDDILICTPYKSGTTWMQMIVASLIFGTSEFYAPMAEISPWMELRTGPVAETHALYAAQTHRRFIKTHSALDGLPWRPEARYIVVGRDPRDVFLSMFAQISNTRPDATALFMEERRAAGEVREPPPDDPNDMVETWLTEGTFEWERDGAPYWSIFNVIETFWAHRDQPNMLLAHYGDMKRDLEGEMRRVARFLEIDVEDAVWPDLVRGAGFEAMRANADRLAPNSDHAMWKDNKAFFRSGASGGWRDVLTPENQRLFEETMARNYPDDMIAWMKHGSA